ncbi:acetate kinase, partial [Erwinia amylovora]|nr:acetate kinase [Erwinia amylovora]
SALMDGRLDSVIFTGCIGENSSLVLELTMNKLALLVIEVDHQRNLDSRFGKSGFIKKEGSRPPLVQPTNEELLNAQDASLLTA